jgi:hypothetical protein
MKFKFGSTGNQITKRRKSVNYRALIFVPKLFDSLQNDMGEVHHMLREEITISRYYYFSYCSNIYH